MSIWIVAADAACARLVCEWLRDVPKDLTRHPVTEIREHLLAAA